MAICLAPSCSYGPGEPPKPEPECPLIKTKSLCSSQPGSVTLSNKQLFSKSELIRIPSYEYGNYAIRSDSGQIALQTSLFISDCCSVLKNVSVHSSTPVICWKEIDNPLMAGAIFKRAPQVDSDGVIKNTSDILWIWHNGLTKPTRDPGSSIFCVDFDEGRALVGEEVSDQKAEPLKKDNVYYLAIWAWNSSGTKISHSSAAIPFVVDVFGDTVSSGLERGNFLGEWDLHTSKKISVVGPTDTFPLKEIRFGYTTTRTADTCYYTYAHYQNGINAGTWDIRENTLKFSNDIILDNLSMTCDGFSARAFFQGEVFEVVYKESGL